MKELRTFGEYNVSSTAELPTIEKIKGSLEPLTLEGGDEPLVQVINKINELVEIVNTMKRIR